MHTHMGISIIRGIIRQSIYQNYIFRPKGGGGGGRTIVHLSFFFCGLSRNSWTIHCEQKQNRTVDPDLLDSATRFFASGFYHESSSPKPLISDKTNSIVSIFFCLICGYIHSSRCTTCFVETGGKWKKSSIRKVFNILFFLRSL